ncbi:MAG: AAA family ATPase [Planctomycetota bacterium]|nr:AAA family ATPase [Planctomycetota bacterium]
MILHSLQAKNFMKYRSIRIAKLPTTGLIGIIGDNESGKTTLGHAILFSLFGEAPDGDVHRLIHWDEDQMKVGLEFTAEGHGRFVVYREIDRRGTNYVKLRNTDDEKDSCSGVMAVEARMKRILGVSAEEFKVSFFMAQKDVDFLRPDRDASPSVLDRILGLETLISLAQSAEKSLEEIRAGCTKISEELKVRSSIYQGSFEDPERELLFIKEIDELKESIERIAKHATALSSSEDALANDVAGWEEGLNRIEVLQSSTDLVSTLEGIGRLVDLESSPSQDEAVTAALEGVVADQQRFTAPLETLGGFFQGLTDLKTVVGEAGQEIYEAIRKGADQARSSGQKYISLSRWIRRTSALSFFFGTIAIGSGAWFVYADQNYLGPGPVFERFSWTREMILWALGSAGIAAAVIFYFCVRWNVRLRRRRRDEELLKKETEDLLRDLEERKAFCVSYAERGSDFPSAKLEDLGVPAITESLEALQREHPDLTADGPASSALWSELQEAGGTIRDALEERKRAVAEERVAREEILAERRGKLREAEDSLAAFRQKQEMLKSLGQEKAALERDLGQARHEAKVHETLAEEARSAARGMKERFGPALARFLKPILPRVTAGRYTNVRVGPDLGVRVFSTDKNDFLSLSELSGGTLEQLLLAVRLGLSQALILSRGAPELGPQFLFLDEPFPSSDRSRSTQFAKLLQELGPFSQVFVTTQAQEVLQEAYDMVVHTRLDISELAAAGSDGAAAEGSPEIETPPSI